MALKARVESLRKSVKDTSARVNVLRKQAPELMKKQVHASLQEATSALDVALASGSEQPAAAPKTPLTVSKAVSEAFVEDSLDLARRAAALHAALPDQVTKGKAAVKMCQEWSRKPLSSAEALLAEHSVASPKSLGASRRKGAAVRAMRGRQPQ